MITSLLLLLLLLLFKDNDDEEVDDVDKAEEVDVETSDADAVVGMIADEGRDQEGERAIRLFLISSTRTSTSSSSPLDIVLGDTLNSLQILI